ESVDASLFSAFETARAKWEAIITGDIPDMPSGPWWPAPIDDILIYADESPIDGGGHVLAQAGPFYTRDDSHLPINGAMQFDTADVPGLLANGQLSSVVFHEMGHVLGIGTIWSDLGLVSGSGSPNPVFLGSAALAEYRAYAGNPALTSVPLANVGGVGTLESHWRESTFSNEIMTGNINAGSNPISRITAASMIDIGYPAVNVDAAETYNLPSGSNPAPIVTSMTDTPDPVLTGSTMTLNALGVSDASGILSVQFYREFNGISGLQSVGTVQHDTLVGADTSGPIWSATIDTTGFANGQYTYYARVVDAFNRVSNAAVATNTVISDPSLLPDAPSQPSLSASSDSGVSSSDRITNDTTPTYSGTAEPGVTVTLFANDIAIGSIFAATGDWTITPNAPLGDGVYTITARGANMIGEGPASTPSNLTIDTIGPVINSTSFSYLTELAVSFTFAVAPTGVMASDLLLINQTTGATITAASVNR
ncbi:MAG TPA: Ig-like domain-containing protein, partial [Tepidisphaeraceae bacterium]|nr:Ig-like domain-containing protein [Tepidisphaeraceae bacterium]